MFTQMVATPLTDKIWQVSELNQAAKELLDAQFGTLWLEGEISNFSCPSSGHWYFSLKDTSASIRGAMFKFANQRLTFKPKDGLHVVVKAKVSLYAERGEFQIVIEKMLPSGEGQLKLEFEQLKAKLDGMGYFDTAHKKPVPKYPKAIGLITSPTGAALQDMLKVLKRRYPIADLWIYPTAVQGKEAASKISEAIQLAERHGTCEVLILARGGGSLEDLWPFNEEIVASAIYQCRIPIVSGVGHETDFTISDYVADMRAPTPSAAAELVSSNVEDLLTYVNKEWIRLQQSMMKRLETLSQALDYLEKRLVHPKQKLLYAKEQLDRKTERLGTAIQALLKQHIYQMNNLCRALEAMSPLKVLARGYAIVKYQGHIIKHATDVQVGEAIEVRLEEGHIHARVESN